jgi:hypothetical protein
MKTLSHILLVILAFSLAVRVDAQERKELSEVVTGLRDSRDVVTKFDSPLAYFKTLTIKDPMAKLDSNQRYQLAREFLCIHHLTQALSQQSFFLYWKRYPIITLAENTYPGFRKLSGEAGYNTSDIAEFLHRNPTLWAP